MAATREQILAAVKMVMDLKDAVKDAGANGIPSGHLYAMLMGAGCSLESYQRIESIMLESKAIVKRGDLLIWVGPPAEG